MISCLRVSVALYSLPGRHEQRRTFRLRVGRQRHDARVFEAGFTHQSSDVCSSRKPEPHVSHLLAVVLPIVRKHVHHDQPAAWLERACDLGQRAPGLGDVMQAPASLSRHRAGHRQSAALRARRGEVRRCDDSCRRLPRRLQHRRRTVDADDARDERRERGADLTGAATEIADDRGRHWRTRPAPPGGTGRRTSRRALDPTGPPTRRRTPPTWYAGLPAPPEAGADPGAAAGDGRPARGPATTSGASARRAPRASSRRRCWCLRRAPTPIRCRRAP